MNQDVHLSIPDSVARIAAEPEPTEQIVAASTHAAVAQARKKAAAKRPVRRREPQRDWPRLDRILSNTLPARVFPSRLELIPQLNEFYELQLAFYESQILDDEGIIRNGGYFARVGDTLTRHFLMCHGEPVRLPQHSSSRLKSFFQRNQFKTGYGTHGLFPYRGKFHPQMIKGIINVMGLSPGDTIVDPMMGSGTVNIEASLMGIHSVGIDASPFCRFMAQSKLDGLTVPLEPIRLALEHCGTVFEHFKNLAGQPERGGKMRLDGYASGLFSETASKRTSKTKHSKKGALPNGCKAEKVYNFLLLAYLDSAGYSERSTRKPPFEQFRAILSRYLFVVEKIQKVLDGAESELGHAKILEGDARSIPLEESSVDGVLFSPPYSFAIDYLENDSFHLGYLGVDIEQLKEGMIGLRGRTLNQKFGFFKADMEKVLSECARILRPGRVCTIVVGTNNNQLSKVLGVPPEEVLGLDQILAEIGGAHGLKPLARLERQITGMMNTMRTEFILMLQRE